MALCLRLLLVSAALHIAECINVVGYVPEYRYQGLNWDKAVRYTTHLVLFSLEPKEDGQLGGLQHLTQILDRNSPLQMALSKHGGKGPKLLVALGGAGRSAAFAKIAGSKKLRKRVAKQLTSLFSEYPVLSGVDFDWETPRDSKEWKDFGKLANEVRTALEKGGPNQPILSMTFYPLTGSVPAFAGIRSMSGDKSLVELFDVCNAMTYSIVDHDGRHSTPKMDKETVAEWLKSGLPIEKLSLGIPFFGIAKDGRASGSFAEMVQKEPTLLTNTDRDITSDGSTFVNADSMVSKVEFAIQEGCGAVMLWELGQDLWKDEESLLHHVWAAASHVKGELFSVLGFSISEDLVFKCLTAIIGGYYSALVIQKALHPIADQPWLVEKSHKSE